MFRVYILIFTILLSTQLRASFYELLTQSAKKRLAQEEILSQANITSLSSNTQKMKTSLSGLLALKCEKSLRVLGRYEAYSNYISYVKTSTYEKGKLFFKLDHFLLPFPVTVDLKMPRIDKVGDYRVQFSTGFLKGLMAKFHIEQTEAGCYFETTSEWSGPNLPIPSPIFSLFVQTASRMAMEKLFRVVKAHYQ